MAYRAVAVSWLTGNSYALPIVAYGFVGVESVTVTAFEARYYSSLRFASQSIAYFIFILYLLSITGEMLNVPWTDSHLPTLYGGITNNTYTASATLTNPPSSSTVIIAAWDAGWRTIPSILNGCFVFSVLSAANTSLYIASRTLYGMTRELPDTNLPSKILRSFSIVTDNTKVPVVALIVSTISFCWLPFLQLKKGYAILAVSSFRP